MICLNNVVGSFHKSVGSVFFCSVFRRTKIIHEFLSHKSVGRAKIFNRASWVEENVIYVVDVGNKSAREGSEQEEGTRLKNVSNKKARV